MNTYSQVLYLQRSMHPLPATRRDDPSSPEAFFLYSGLGALVGVGLLRRLLGGASF